MKTQNWMIAPLLGLLFPVMGNAQSANPACAKVEQVKVDIGNGQILNRTRVKTADDLACAPAQPKALWKVKKDHWDEEDDLNWQKFIRSIGKAIEEKRCNTVDSCLISPANPYRDDFDMQGTHFADCADFPMYLRAYFAFKNNLPFSFGREIQANAPNRIQLADADAVIERAQSAYDQILNQYGASEEKIASAAKKLQEAQSAKEELIKPTNVLYSGNGNYYNGRNNIVNTEGAPRDFFAGMRKINDQFSSGSLRMLLTPPGKPEADFYAPKITRSSIKPGTVVYNVAGHVATVYEVTIDGDVKIMDAKLDSSVGVDVYSNKYSLSRFGHAAGFKNFRPLKVINAQYDNQGNISKGQTVLTPNEQIADFSLEQYLGNENKDNTETTARKWIFRGKSLPWFDFVQERLSDVNSKYNPIDKMKEKMNRICDQFQQRGASIETIVHDGISRKPHPKNLPQNVYNGDPEWHEYAIYRRDVNIRRQIFDVIDSAKKYMDKWMNKDERIAYSGTNLKKDMIKAYNDSLSKCNVSYVNSAGKKITMSFGVALKRVTSISPTPYFCPERMWGAKYRSEMAACPDDQDKLDWYTLTQFFRNSKDVNSEKTMNWSIQDLRNKVDDDMADSRDRSADFDILTKLNEL